MRRFLPRSWKRHRDTHEGAHRPGAASVTTADRRTPVSPVAPAPSRPPQSNGSQRPSGGSPVRTVPGAPARPASPATAASAPQPAPLPGPVSTPETGGGDGGNIMRLVDELCVAYANMRIAKTMAEYTDDAEARTKHLGTARYWDTTGRALHHTISKTLGHALTAEAGVESFLPVQPMPTGEVTLRARDDRNNPVVVWFTPAQALAVGAHLTAYAALGLDRTGGKVADALPPIATQPPFIAPKFIPTPGPAPAADRRGTATIRPAAR